MKPSRVAAVLPKLIETGRSIFLWGDPGIGKSDLVRATASQLGIELVDLRLNIYDPTDLKGYPTIAGTGKSQAMRFIPPAILPTKGKGIVLLDELPSAPPAVQAAAYQLVLDRKLNEYTLPEGWAVIAAGNHARDGGVHYALPAALANRFIHIEMECDAQDWDFWAASNGISPLTRAYIRFNAGALHDPGQRKSGMAFPTPRSWSYADAIIRQNYSAREEAELLKGTVGEGAAIDYASFIAAARELPTIDDILKAPATAPLPRTPGARYAVTTLLERQADTKNIEACMTYITRLDVEYQAAFAVSISRIKRELMASKSMVAWCMANQAVIFA